MAERRMFAKTVINSDTFLEMPISSQCLYFHLGMRADDDGFVNNPKRIIRMIGCSEDDLKLLIAKQFVITFESGVIVIRHWKIHNSIRKDRYRPTTCSDEMKLLTADQSVYDMVNQWSTNGQPTGNQLTTNWQPTDNQWLPQDRIGKGSLGQDRQGQENSGDERPDFNTIQVYASSNLIYITPTAMEELNGMLEDFPEDVIRFAIDTACDNGKRTWAYARAILRNWLNAGIRTLGAAKAESESHRGQKTQPKVTTTDAAHGYQEHKYTEADFENIYFDPEKDEM